MTPGSEPRLRETPKSAKETPFCVAVPGFLPVSGTPIGFVSANAS